MSKKKEKDNISVGAKGKIAQKPKNMWGTVKRLASYIKKSSPMLVVALIVR